MPGDRRLEWDGCVNVRDLGGHVTEDGRETRHGQVVRADSLGRLSDAGWKALTGYGVGRIVDLRGGDELVDDPPREQPVEIVHVPLLDTLDPDAYAEARRKATAIPEAALAKATMYAVALERCRPGFADALRAIAEAPRGPVVVHCNVGKDRTGLLVALLLRLCRVPPDAIDADYAASEPRVTEEWIAAADDAEERAWRRRLASPPGAMAATLAELERGHGSVEAFVSGSGLSAENVGRLRARLVG